LDKEIDAAALKKAEVKVKRETEQRKKREEDELKRREEERKKRGEDEEERERKKAEEKVKGGTEKWKKREEEERKETDEKISGALQEITANALSPSTCLLDLFKEKGFDEILCEEICHELGANKCDDWILVEDHHIDYIKNILKLKPIQIKKLKMLVEECKKIVEDQKSKAGGGGGSAVNAALSMAQDARIGGKRKIEGEELLNDGKTSKNIGGGGAHLPSAYPAVDQTIWAHLEFEDNRIVPLRNSVSTSFYIGREPPTIEHNHRFYYEDDKVWRRVSRDHCNILRLDTGSFSSYILRLHLVLLIFMKYVN
jgi:hypothetical protein